MNHFLVNLAQAAAPSSSGPGGMLLPMIAMVGIFYFLVLRPQSKKAKELTLQVQEGVRLRVTRASVQGRYGASAAVPAKADSKTDSKAS